MNKNYLIYGLLLFMVLVLIVIGAWMEGMRTDRWWDPPQTETLKSFIAGIHNFPEKIGNWEGDLRSDRREMEEEIAKEAGAEASLSRVYTSSEAGIPISINIICGLARKVTIHTPDACFRGGGFTMEGDIETMTFRYPVPPVENTNNPASNSSENVPIQNVMKDATFKTAIFTRESKDGTVERQRVFWGWKGVDSDWIAPELPRNRWSPTEPIIKLYILVYEQNKNSTLVNSPSVQATNQFTSALFPALEKLFSGTYASENKNIHSDQKFLADTPANTDSTSPTNSLPPAPHESQNSFPQESSEIKSDGDSFVDPVQDDTLFLPSVPKINLSPEDSLETIPEDSLEQLELPSL
ncbi:MAG: exosortase-associated EpsI family protein [Planctomycetia bacterium]|nr:exosortase-associated EpsI family protein [Planctomycetia bacterium]